MWRTLTTAENEQLPVWEALPQTPNGAALVLLHEAFRVTAHIKRMCSFFADNGYHVLAPDMLAHSAEPMQALPINKNGLDEARRLITNVPWDHYLAQMQACVDDLLTQNAKVGLIGYCFGGSMAYFGATRCTGVSAADSYYGGRLHELVAEGQANCPAQIHLATQDRYIPLQATLDNFAKYDSAAKVYVYEADHGFNREDGVSYDKQASDLARARSLAFFGQHLVNQG